MWPFTNRTITIIQRGKPYLKRWYLLPRNKFFNLYLHKFLASDDDRALHDHPWWNISIILKGGYIEHLPYHPFGIMRNVGDIVFRRAEQAHRIELHHEGEPLKVLLTSGGVEPFDVGREYHSLTAQLMEAVEKAKKSGPVIPAWSLFITGPRIREWGFHCPKGWRSYWHFLGTTPRARLKGDETGPGCD